MHYLGCISYDTYYTYMHSSCYISYETYCTYTNNTNYDRSVKILELQDRRAAIAETVDALGDQFRPAMRAGWLSYIRQAYPANAAPVAGPPVGQGLLVLPD